MRPTGGTPVPRTTMPKRNLLLFVLPILLAGCVGGEDGAQLSDEEKLKRASGGRADYGKQMQGGKVNPGAAAGQ